MLIIPAIDIINGQCVRLTRGDFNTKKVYYKNPVEVAVKFEKQGADMLHIVDLDGARLGRPVNDKTILKILDTISIPVEVGGGIRRMEDANKYFKAGVEKIVIGSKAFEEEIFIKKLIDLYGPQKIVIGIDAKNNKVAVSGWNKVSKVNYLDFAQKTKKIGIKEIIFTDIKRDGMLGAPNFNAYKELGKLNINIFASGGIADLKSIKKLSKLNVCGVIIGKALYEYKLNLTELKV